MAVQGQTFRSAAAPATTQKVYNITTPGTANTEFSQALSDSTKQLIIRCRGTANIQMTFTSGESGTKFLTIPEHTTYAKENLNLQNKTVYMQVDKATQIVEIEEWS